MLSSVFYTEFIFLLKNPFENWQFAQNHGSKAEGLRYAPDLKTINTVHISCNNILTDGLKGVSPSVTFGEGSEGASPERRVEDPSLVYINKIRFVCLCVRLK